MVGMVCRRPLTALALVLSVTATAAPSLVIAQPGAQRPAAAWPHQGSDVPADEAVRFGVLPNGMRYIIMRNEAPPGAASLRMRIDAGSLHEAEDQRGVAHFLEHLTLNETKNLPEGELLRTLERAGLEFGADTNAMTTFEQTVYKLDLPRTDAQTIDTGLFLLREVASEATLRPAVVESERGIILSEERSRSTAQLRLAVDELATSFPRDRLGNRLPIGTPEVIRTVTPQRIRDFYHAYYRPERATLIAVGAFDVAELERKIRDKFGSWRGQGAAGPDLPPLAPRGDAPQTRVMVEPGVPARVAMSWIAPRSREPDSRARRMESIRRGLAVDMLNRRLERLASGGEPPFIAGLGLHAVLADRAETFQLLGVIQPARWQPAVRTLEQENRRVVEHGFTAAELTRAVNETRAQLQAAVSGASARRSANLAEAMVGAVNEDVVFTSPATDLALFEQAVADLNPANATAAYRQLVGGQPIVHLSSPQAIEGGEAAVRTALAEAQRTPVTAPAAAQAVAWPYERFGTPGQVIERRELAEVGATAIRFANGVRLTVKPTQFAQNEVRVAARFGGGRLALPRSGANAAWAVPLQVFSGGGLGRLTSEQIAEVLAGKVVEVQSYLGEDNFVLSGKTRPEDFATQLQLMAAYTTDPGFNAANWDRFRSFSGQLHDQFEGNPGGIFSRDVQALLRSGDPRWAVPSRSEMAAMPVTALTDMLRQPLASGPLEVIVVGDISVDEAVRQVAATFGALPARAPAPAMPPRGVRFPAGGSITANHRGRADQALGFVAWPTAGFYADTRQARGLDLLSRVLQLRLTAQIREAQGASYSPQAGHSASDALRDYGYLFAAVEVPPTALDGFFRDVRTIARALREQPIAADELERARRPLVESMTRSRNSSNSFWLEQLAGVQTEPTRAADLARGVAQVEALTPADLQRLARAYLVDGKAWRLSVLPNATAPAAGGAGGQ